MGPFFPYGGTFRNMKGLFGLASPYKHSAGPYTTKLSGTLKKIQPQEDRHVSMTVTLLVQPTVRNNSMNS